MEQLKNDASTTVYLSPGSLPTGTSQVYFVATNRTSKEVQTTRVGLLINAQNNRYYTVTLPTPGWATGMWFVQIFTDLEATNLVNSFLGYASKGGNTAVPSDPDVYVTGDNDPYPVYYE